MLLAFNQKYLHPIECQGSPRKSRVLRNQTAQDEKADHGNGAVGNRTRVLDEGVCVQGPHTGT